MPTDDRIFPSKLADFNNYLLIAVPWLVSEVLRLKIPAAMITALSGFYSAPLTGWTTIYPLTLSPATNTKNARDNRDDLRVNIEAQMRLIFAEIPESVLTNDDRNKLHLFKRDADPTRAIIMAYAPEMDKQKIDHLVHILRFGDPENPDTSEMPDKQEVYLESFVGEAGLAPDKIAFANGVKVTRSLFEVKYTEADVTKTAYYRCCYQNTRGERGTWGAVLAVVIA